MNVSTIITVDIPADEFALQETLESVSDIEFEVERVAAHEGDSVTPYIWVTSDVLDQVDEAFENDPSIRHAELLETVDGSWLYRMDWIEKIELITYMLTEEEATVMDAYGREDRWTLRILFPKHDGLSRTNEFCENAELTFTVKTIHEMEANRHGRFGLTEKQHETLQTAIENGFYDIPRSVTIDELAGELDVTHQAISERLRRAHRNLVQDALLLGPPRDAN